MLTSFSVTHPRILYDGNDVIYREPILHPNRNCPGFHDFVYMVYGKWDVRLNGELYTFQAGDAFILPAGFCYEGNEYCMPNTDTFYFHCSPNQADVCNADPPEDDVRFTIPTVIHCGGNVIVPQLFSEIALLAASKRPDKNAAATSLIHSLIYFLSQISDTSTFRKHDIVSNILERMKHAPDRFFKEAEIAAEQFVSVKTLRAVFLQRFGKTFYQYQLESKLAKASFMLLNQPNIRLKTVAAALGFCDEFHLSKSFKRVYGISPSAYRAKLREEKERTGGSKT